MKISDFYDPASSNDLTYRNMSQLKRKNPWTEYEESKDINEETVPLGIIDWAKQNNNCAQLIWSLKIEKMNNQDIYEFLLKLQTPRTTFVSTWDEEVMNLSDEYYLKSLWEGISTETVYKALYLKTIMKLSMKSVSSLTSIDTNVLRKIVSFF